jgi:cytochrome c oxidase subunit II
MSHAPRLLAAGVGGFDLQSVLDPAGPQSTHIAGIWWLFFWITAAVFALVLVVLFAAILRSIRKPSDDHPRPISPQTHRRLTWTVGGAIAATTVTLLVLLGASVTTGRALESLPSGSAEPGGNLRPLTIEIIGRQWWWEVRYLDPNPSLQITDANEIHLPIGRPVLIRGTSRDVIHSFWVPNLHGKRDLIPGYWTGVWLRADRPGVFRGQCAEFCGLQHAHMALQVVAEPPAAFAAWVAAQRRPPLPPATPQQARGRQVFELLQCALCHTVRGTGAGGRIGPDLTHLASRRTLAAGTLPNTRGHLAGWIADPQSIKPGNRMPPTQIAAGDLHALLAYLESLE